MSVGCRCMPCRCGLRVGLLQSTGIAWSLDLKAGLGVVPVRGAREGRDLHWCVAKVSKGLPTAALSLQLLRARRERERAVNIAGQASTQLGLCFSRNSRERFATPGWEHTRARSMAYSLLPVPGELIMGMFGSLACLALGHAFAVETLARA
jgi:hypothetical protein